MDNPGQTLKKMKWINDHDDYFLRDFNNRKDGEDTAGKSDGESVTPGSASDGKAEQTQGAGSQGSASQEFSFTGGSDSDNTMPEAAAAQETPMKKRSRARRRLVWFALIVAAVLFVAFYIRYFVPYTSATLTTGYVTLVEKRGIFFKTFEGEMISESHLNDTSKVYSRDFYFSIPNDSLGRLIQSYQGTGQKVTLTTQKYYGTLPWRGSQKTVVTGVSVK